MQHQSSPWHRVQRALGRKLTQVERRRLIDDLAAAGRVVAARRFNDSARGRMVDVLYADGSARRMRAGSTGGTVVGIPPTRATSIELEPCISCTGTREHRPRERREQRHTARSTSSGDSGDDVPLGRRCAAPWCEHLVYGPPKQRYCGTERCDQVRAAERQRKRRSGDLTALEREQLEDARRAGYVGDTAFAGPQEHALSFLWKHELVEGFDPGEYEALLHRPA